MSAPLEQQDHKHETQDETYVRMINQIAKNLMVMGEDQAVKGTAEHIRQFWAPRMRKDLIAFWQDGGQGLTPQSAKAVESLTQSVKN